MRAIDGDALKERIDYCVTKGMGGTIAFTFKHMIDEQPTMEPDKRWSRLMMYLADLQLTFAPYDGHGDEKLYMFVTGLIAELESWTGGGSDEQTDRR